MTVMKTDLKKTWSLSNLAKLHYRSFYVIVVEYLTIHKNRWLRSFGKRKEVNGRAFAYWEGAEIYKRVFKLRIPPFPNPRLSSPPKKWKEVNQMRESHDKPFKWCMLDDRWEISVQGRESEAETFREQEIQPSNILSERRKFWRNFSISWIKCYCINISHQKLQQKVNTRQQSAELSGPHLTLTTSHHSLFSVFSQ